MKEFQKKLLSLPSSQFWVIVLGIWVFGYILAATLGPVGILLSLFFYVYSGYLGGTRVFSTERCDK